MLLTRIAICACAALFLSSSPTLAAREVHIVGLYEGNGRTADRLHGPEAKLQIDRPGQDVVLILTSDEPVRWHIDLAPGSRIEAIVLGGKGSGRHEVLVNDQPFDGALQRRENLRSAYTTETGIFRSTVRHAITDWDVEAVASFNGHYAAPSETIEITKVARQAPELTADPLAGVVSPSAPVPPRFVDPICPDGPPPVRFTSDGFKLRQADCSVQFAPVSLDVPRISWPVDAVIVPSENAA